MPHSLPGADYWEFDHSEPPLPASGKGILFTSAFFDGLRRPRWLDAGGQTLDLGGVLLRFIGNPYKEVVSTSAQTSVFATPPTIKGSTLGIERGLRITVIGDMLNNAGANHGGTYRVKYGATTIATLTPAAVGPTATRRPWKLIADLYCRGATGVQVAHATCETTNEAGVSGTSLTLQHVDKHVMSMHNSVAEDSTADQTLDITIQPTASSANISFRVFVIVVEQL